MNVGSGRNRAALVALTVVASLLAFALPADAKKPPKASGPTRYSLVHGCYAIQPASGGFLQKIPGGYNDLGTAPPRSEAFRMQATALGRYLLYGRDADFLAAGTGNTVVTATSASPDADWSVVSKDGGKFEIRNSATDRPLVRGGDGTIVQGAPGQSDATTLFSFAESSGCADYPEITLNATGQIAKGSTPYTQATGMADMHNHVSAFEFLGGKAHCGKPWDPYGVDHALVDCPDHYPNGQGAILENLFYGNPLRTHDPVGWPSFKSWPAYDSLTHEQTYYRWIQRAWMGGERLMVNNLVENGVLCRIYPLGHNTSCNEMDAVREQAKLMYQLQDYIDAQAGGPGQGFFRIVTDPFQARKVINDGKLAVVLGIEESELFGCTEYQDVPQCTLDDVKNGIKEVQKLGVSSFYPVHKFDNAFGGTRFDAGAVGAVINNGQFMLSGHYWETEPCTGDEVDNPITPTVGSLPLSESQAADELGKTDDGGMIEAGFAAYGPGGFASDEPQPARQLPIYPPGDQCNKRGLTDLGKKLINLMVDNHLLVEVDHMSVKTRDATLKILQDRGYSGVLSGHEWSDKHSYKPILDLGGMVGGRADNVENFVADYEKYSKDQSPKYFFGWGYGPDANGLGQIPEPSTDDHPVQYPFKSLDGKVTFDKQVSGTRTFDVNTDGTAHYGLLPDWFEDLRLADGNGNLTNDLQRGAEAYLETWERAYGVAAESCRPAKERIGKRGYQSLKLKLDAFEALKRGGQPTLRDDDHYLYCVAGSAKARMLVSFDKKGKAAVIASSGKKAKAGGVRVGTKASELAGKARRRGSVYVSTNRGKTRYVYLVRKGKVRAVGTATKKATRKKGALKKSLKPLR